MNAKTLRLKQLTVIAIAMLVIQAMIMFFFKGSLGTSLPVYFAFDGSVIYWISYAHTILGEGILLLLIMHIVALILASSIVKFLNGVPIISSLFGNIAWVGYWVFSWLESLSWAFLLYFFLYENTPQIRYLMFAVNVANLIFVIVFGVHRRRKSSF